MAIQYDPNVIYKFGERLYARAASIAFVYGFLGLVMGTLGGIAAGSALNSPGTGLLIGALAGVVLGVMLGIERGFALRLQAQQALCQVKIEESVRFTASAHGLSGPQRSGSYEAPQATYAAPPNAPSR